MTVERDRRLWVVVRSYLPDEGGVQTYAREVAHAYAALGWRVTVFAKSSAGPRRFEADGVTVLDVGDGSKPAVYGRLFAAMVRARIAGERPRAIHACTWRSALPAAPFRAPLIVTAHGREVTRPRGIARLLMRLVLARASRVVAVSDATRSLLLGGFPALAPKTITVWNGASRFCADALAARRHPLEGTLSLFTLCRLVPRKNVANAVAAVANRLAAKDAGLRYAIAGRGPEADRIAAAIRDRGVGGGIELLGYVDADEIVRRYRTSDIFLHPQIALEDGDEIEGFGLVVADAMASGMACIVGRDGGPAELIRDGETGFVVDGRSTESIDSALQALIDRPDRIAAMGAAAAEWAGRRLCWKAHCRASLEGIADAR